MIFPASVCATFRWARRQCISHTRCSLSQYIGGHQAPQGVLLGQVFFGYYDAVFYNMGRWSGSQRRRSSALCGRGLMTDALMTDTPPHPAGEQVVRPLWAGFGPSQGTAAAETLSHPREAQHLLPEPLSRSIKMRFSVRKSAPKHVHLIFPASVCATFHMVFSVTLRSLTSGSTSSTLHLQGTAGST